MPSLTTVLPRRLPGAVSLLLLLGCPPPAEGADYHSVYRELTHARTDPGRMAAVHDILLVRDAGSWLLNEGKVYACRPIDGREWALVFAGRGSFRYAPPTAVEREQLFRFMDRPALEEPFRTLVLLFTDSTFEEITRRVRWEAGSVPKEIEDQLVYATQFLTDGGVDEYCDPSFMAAVLDEGHAPFFHAHCSESKLEPMFFRIDPFVMEEVRFGRRDMRWPGYRWEEINRFHTQEEYATGADRQDEVKDRFRVVRTSITADIENDLDLTAAAKLVGTSTRDQRWMLLQLDPRLEVDSVIWGDGRRVDAVHGDTHSDLWIDCGGMAAAGQVCSLTVHYHGDIMDQDGSGRIAMRSSVLWYPRDLSTLKGWFDIGVTYPSRYTLVSVGANVDSRSVDGRTTSRWVTARSVPSASFNLGLFTVHPLPDSAASLLGSGRIPLPAGAVYMSEGTRVSSRFSTAGDATSFGVDRGEMVNQVVDDVALSSGFFTELLGPPVIDRLHVAETPLPHGEAFAGLVNLWSATFELGSTKGLHRVFRAHEVAHQWWGIGVGYKSYHDQWLSEGFCTYLGGWYLQAVQRDNDLFFRLLASWRESILRNRDYLLGKGREAGPIWLGVRTLSADTEDDLDLIIYRKSALVLHMLRNLLLDLETLREDQFRGLLSGFYRQYRNSRASTRDFQAFTEKYLGADMGWFFNQWVYGTAIPFYRYAHTTVQTDSGFVVRCRIKQEGVPPAFRMFVPVQVKAADGSVLRVRVLVTGESVECDLPPTATEPAEVVFNYLDSVLCGAEEMNW